MATINKNFKIKNGLVVEGTTATFNGNAILSETASDQYILDLVGGVAYITSVAGNLAVTDGELTINESGLVTSIAGSYLFNDGGALAVDTEGLVDNGFVDTSSIQTLTNKTFGDSLHFQDGINNYSAIYANSNDLKIDGSNNIVLTTNNGDIILNPDGNSYLGSATAGNEIATQTDLDNLGTRDNSPNTLLLRDGFGNAAIGQLDAETKFTSPNYVVGDAGQIHDVNGVLEIKGYSENANVEITGDMNVNLYTINGDVNLSPAQSVNLNPGEGSGAYVNEDEIVTRTASQTLMNKTIGNALTFNDGGDDTTIAPDGDNLELRATNGQVNLYGGAVNINPTGNIWLTSNTGDIVLSADNAAYYGGTTAADEIATHGYVDNAVSGLSWKQAVNLKVTSNINLADAAGTYDGHAVDSTDVGYRFLLTDQNTASENGIYVGSENAGKLVLTRASDSDTYQELIGAAVYVMEGTQYGSTSWVQGDHYLTDFTGQNWTQFSGQGSVTAGEGINVDGLEVSVDFNSVASQTDLSDGLALKQDIITAGDGINIDTVDTVPHTVHVHTKTSGGLTVDNTGLSVDRTTVDTWYDASGAAGTAEDNANSYTDTQLNSYTPTSSLETTIDGYGFAYSSEIPTSTDELGEGTNNLYYTDARAEDAAGNLLANATKSNIDITYDGTSLTITAEDGIAGKTTDDLTEGSTNLYFTDGRALGAINNVEISPLRVSINDFRLEEATQQSVGATSTVNLHSFSYPYESAKYLVRVVGSVSGTKHSQLTEILLTTDGNDNIAITEYGNIHTSDSPLASFSAVVAEGEYVLTATTAVANVEIITAATMLSWVD